MIIGLLFLFGRSNLGRVLAGGGGWTDVPVDEVRDPGRRYATSLGRALAGKGLFFYMDTCIRAF